MNKEIKIKDFTMSSLGIFEGEKFIECDTDWSLLKENAAKMTAMSGIKHTISTLQFEGTEENPIILKGKDLFSFSLHDDTVYIVDVIESN